MRAVYCVAHASLWFMPLLACSQDTCLWCICLHLSLVVPSQTLTTLLSVSLHDERMCVVQAAVSDCGHVHAASPVPHASLPPHGRPSPPQGGPPAYSLPQR